MTMKGSCLCGAVEITVSAEPIFVGKCYCTDCQKGSGGGHNTVVAVPDTGLGVAGETTSFAKPGDSGKPVTRHFCPKCGTTLYSQPEAMPGTSMVRAGVLDHAPAITATMAIYCAHAPAWDQPPADIRHFAGMPQPGG